MANWGGPNKYRIDGDVAYIELTGKDGLPLAETAVDASELERVLSRGRWYCRLPREGYATYAVSGSRKNWVSLHRFLMDAPKGMMVDHINRDGLDNRIANLRIVTNSQNQQNSLVPRNSRTGIRNVYFDRATGRFCVQLTREGVSHRAGFFDTLEAAEAASIAARKRLHTHCPENSMEEAR